jgi:hypothetical protein
MVSCALREGGRRMAHQATADEKHCDCDVLQVLSTVLTTPTTQMLKKDVRGTIRENKSTFDKLGRWSPFLIFDCRPDVPCLPDCLVSDLNVERRQQANLPIPTPQNFQTTGPR